MDTNELMKEALAYHAEGGPGKIEIRPTKPDATQYDLSLAYSPGVAAPCLAIADDPAKAYDYTIKGNLVAVITNGTAVLGLGDIGPLAAKPVMEGKCMLFKHFSGINAFDIEIDTIDPEEFIAAVKRIAPTFGGINLEDIKAPECFEIERRLVEELDIPVMHDDQHGTAIIASAALINAMHLSGKRIDEAQIVVNGAGAAAIACARMFLALGARRDQITMCDSRGVVTTRRTDLNSVKREFATDRPVTTAVTDLEAAKASGAKALFEEKYGQTVRVVSVGDFSSELCGGTHVSSSGMIGSLKIVSEESIGSGIRRITAVTGMTTVHLLQELSRTADELSARLAVKRPLLIEKVRGMEEEIKELKRQIDGMSRARLAGSIDSLIAKKTLAGGAVNLYIGRVDGQDMELLRESGDKFKDGDPKAVFVVFSKAAEDKVQILCMLGEEAQKKKLHAGKIVKELAALVGGSGGGRPNMAQAGGKEPAKIDAAIAAAVDLVAKFIGA